MSVATINRKTNRLTTFEDLRGLRAECYVRDSTLDQKDGFGPEIQRHNEERFAQSYGLLLGSRWYSEFVSGRSADKRREFQQVIEDARLDQFDVLLVDHTSRFGRNQSECIRYKDELKLLGKTVIFVSQGIISGSDRDFLSERINETLDEQYSRNLSRYISAGLAEKAEHGLHVGPAPLGYRSELTSGRRERKVPDPMTMPALLMALRDYSTGSLSYAEVSDRLNSQGFRQRSGRPFTSYSIRDILGNRFYQGKVVYHKDQLDERVVDGSHDVPAEVRELWTSCQAVKSIRAVTRSGHPRVESHGYPFSRILRCQRCGSPYHGEAVYYRGNTDLRMTHERRTVGKACSIRPRSRSVDSLTGEFCDRVVSQIHLEDSWKPMVMKALLDEKKTTDTHDRQDRLARALENLRKQHLWGDISDDVYRRDRVPLERQLQDVSRDSNSPELPNLERAAQLLNALLSLWSHPGVTHQQREALVQEVFAEISIDGKELVSVRPKPAYLPLFASMAVQDSLGNRDSDSPPPPPLTFSASTP
jgi:DNA invertase Pin-like site-specific DNA recombinase